MEYVIEFVSHPQLVGTFHSPEEAEEAGARIAARRGDSSWRVRPMRLASFELGD